MKRNLFKQLLLSAISILVIAMCSIHAKAQTTLTAGDIAIIGFNTNLTPDDIVVLVLKDLSAGTVFYVNDNEITTAGGTTFADLNEAEASFTVKAGQSITAGTVIVLPWAGGATSTTLYDWSVTAGAGLGNDEEIYIYNAPSITASTPTSFIFGATQGNNTGLIPNGLVNNQSWIDLGTSRAYRYKLTGVTYTGTKATLLSAIGTIANWEGAATYTLAANNWTFNVTGAAANPTVNLSVNTNSTTEAAATQVTVTATASAAVTGNQTVSLSVTGTGITAGDYSLSNNTITILNGSTVGSVTFTVVNDLDLEPTETATLTIASPSSGISIGATSSQNITITDNDVSSQFTSVDLCSYVRVGRYDLPEPTRTTAPANSVLAQEVSGVTYNWDTHTLFVVGDGGTSVVQVSLTGQLINSMTLATGGSPQGTEFYDPEGISYIGNGKFVITEERDRNAVSFTYVAGSTLTRANAQTVKLGTFVQNIGLEGLSYDPLTNGYVFVKEVTPLGIFQTGIDFNAGTATNGSATTENSVNLFNPALTNLLDFADVFSLSNLPALNGQPHYNNLLVLSQESGKILNVDRSGNISSSLSIFSDAGNPLTVAAQQHEGLTMDNEGNLYVVSENGGGDFDHPQLWVYAPSVLANQAPSAITLSNSITSIAENTSTTAAIKVADVNVVDDGLVCNNVLSLTGADAAFFELIGTELFIKAGTVLDFETKSSYAVTIDVNDATTGTSPDASLNYTLTITDVIIETPTGVTLIVSEVAPWGSGNSPVAADWFELTNTGTSSVNITGWKVDDNSNSFATAVPLAGISTIAPGESVIFIESANAAIAATFRSNWFGVNPPAGLQVGTYTGSGIGLSTGGDAVNIFNASGELQAKVIFGTSPAGPSFATFNNAIGINNNTISTLSVVGVNDAFVAVNSASEIGSPGTIGKLYITEVAPWSSSNSPVGADWFEITNTKATAVNIAGWKMDDNSGSPAAAVALNGISSIAPGESVIFIETANPATLTTSFLQTWFGANPPAGLQIGSYTGSGVGLSTGSDAVNLYNSTGTLQASVLFGASSTGIFRTFDNAAKLNNTTISQLSAVAVNGAFIAFNDVSEIGSPGTIVSVPCSTLTVTATPGTILCNGGSTIVNVAVSGGRSPYTGTGSFNRTAGTYTFIVTDAYGCAGSTEITITEPAVLNAAESHTTILCDGNTSTVTISATGGTAPYSGTGIFTQATGTQLYNITDANGCISSVNVTVAEATGFPTTSSLAITACDNYSWNGTVYTVSGTYTFLTTNAAGCDSTATLILTINNSTTSSTPVTACGTYVWNGTTYNSTGTYTYSTLNAAGCDSTATLLLTIKNIPATPAALIGQVNVCPYIGAGTQLTYSVPVDPMASSYIWIVPPTVNLVSGQGTNSIVVTIGTGFIANANKQVRVTAVSSCGNSAQALFYLLAQLPTTPQPIVASTSSVCTAIASGATITYTIPKVAAASGYIWTAQAGTTLISHPNGTGVNDTTVTVTFTSGFSTSNITVQSLNDCGTSGTRSLSIVRSNPSTPGLISGPTNACPHISPSGIAATYTVSPVANAVVYTWTLPVGATAVTGQGTNTISFIYPAGYTGGIITVTATNGCGSGGVRSLAINKLNPSTPGLIDAIQLQPCPGRQYSYSIAAMPANAAQLLWTVPTDGTILTGQGTTSITVSYTDNPVNGNVTVQALSNCSNSSTRTTPVKLPACPPSLPFAKSSPNETSNIQQGNTGTNMLIYPNPSSNNFKLKIPAVFGGLITVKILDMQGRELKKIKITEGTEHVSFGNDLAPGTYFIEIFYGRNKSVQTLIKL